MSTTINEATIIHQGFELMLAREAGLTRKKQILQAQAFILNMHTITPDIFEITKDALSEVINRCTEHASTTHNISTMLVPLNIRAKEIVIKAVSQRISIIASGRSKVNDADLYNFCVKTRFQMPYFLNYSSLRDFILKNEDLIRKAIPGNKGGLKLKEEFNKLINEIQ